jgi:hypothetical protein
LGLIIGIPIAVAAGMFLFQTLGRQGWWVSLTSKFMILEMCFPQDSPLMTSICMHVMLAILSSPIL